MVNRIRRVLYYVPKKYLIKIIFALFMLCCFLITVKAETINNVSSSINQACSTNGRFTYSLYNSNSDSFSTGSFKTKYNGVADYIVFDLDYDLLGNASYQLSISAISTDFRNINKSNVFIESSSGCATPTGFLDITNVSFSKSKIVINFKTTSNISRFMVTLGDKGGPAITGISTFGISSIDITTIESNDTQNIIDNQNQNANSIIDNQQQNTQDIIDNQNKNNEELKDTINDSLNSCRPSKNLLNVPSEFIVTSSTLLNISIPAGTYTLSASSITTSGSNSSLFQFTDSDGTIFYYQLSNSYLSHTFTTTETLTLLRVYSQNDWGNSQDVTTTFKNLMLEKGSIATEYEEYGKEVCQSKIDDTNDKLDNLNDSLNNSDVDDNVGSSFFNDFSDEDNGGISGIIKAPLVLINSLLGSTNSCNDLSFPILSTEVSLPCGSLLWSKVPSDVLTIYHTIICGYLSFILLKKLYKDIEDLKNPNDSEVKTTDL